MVVQPTADRVKTGLIGICAITLIAYWPSLQDPLLSDDYILIAGSAQPATVFAHFIAPTGDGAMRPVGEFVFGVYRWWAGPDPARWHFLGLALHLANVLVLYVCCIRYSLSQSAALLACGAFALHPSHPEAVAWVSSTFDLLATLFVLITLIALTFTGWRAWASSTVLTALAILSKESAYALPLIALLILGSNRKRAIACLCTATALMTYRLYVFGGPGGYLDAATGRPQILNLTPLAVVKALIYRPWWPLLFPVDWAVRPNVLLITLLCLASVSFCVVAMRPLAASKALVLLTGALAASLIPPIHLALIGADLQGARVFYLPSAIFMCVAVASVSRPRPGAQNACHDVSCFQLLCSPPQPKRPAKHGQDWSTGLQCCSSNCYCGNQSSFC